MKMISTEEFQLLGTKLYLFPFKNNFAIIYFIHMLSSI